MTNSTDRRQGLIGELGIKKPVRVATTANITLSGLQTIDGVTVVEDDRVLVKNQTTTSENGVYDASSGSWTRSLDFDGNQDVTDGTLVYIREGTTQLKQIWAVSATNPITIDTTSISFVYVVSFGDAGLVAANNLSDVPNKTTARTNLGLEIGTNVQAYDADLATLAALSSIANLTSLASLTGASNKIPYFTAAGTMAIADLFANRNLVINGDGRVAQRGTTFTSATTPNNSDDTYLLDRQLLLSNGNDIVDVSQETTTVPTGSYSSIKFDQETANKQWGYVQILEAKDAAAIIGGTASLSFSARKGESNATIDTLRAAIISWSSTEDVVTSDVVGTWAGAGTNPTLATNWTYENTPSNLTLTTSFQTFKIENVSIDTASTKNVAVFIWLDDTDGTVGDLVYISNIKLEKGTISTPYIPRQVEQEFSLCMRYYQVFGTISWRLDSASNQPTGSGMYFHQKMRTTPSNTIISANYYQSGSGLTITNLSTSGFSWYVTPGGTGFRSGDFILSFNAEL